MENYVVRICRRDDEKSTIAGVVEIADTREEKQFRTREELLTILNAAKAGAHIVWK